MFSEAATYGIVVGMATLWKSPGIVVLTISPMDPTESESPLPLIYELALLSIANTIGSIGMC